MKIVLKENETMQDIVDRLVRSSEMVYNVAPMAYWYENLHENGRIKDIHFSKHMREILGYKSVEEFPDELNTLMTFTHPDDVHIMLENAIAAGTGKIDEYNVEYRIRNASGGYTWCNATGKVVVNHEGVTVGMYGAFIDITGKKSIDESTIIDSFAKEYDAAFFGNLSSRSYKVLSNKDKVANQIVGIITTGEALQKYVLEFVHPDDAHHFSDLFQAELVKERIQIGQTLSFEYRSDTDGDFQWYRATFRRLNENDVLVGFKNCNEEVLERLTNNKLLEGYDALYVVDLDKNSIQPTRSSRVSSVGAIAGKAEYDKLLLKFADTVAPKYRQDWVNFSSRAYMKQYMAREDHREYVYELPGAAKAMRRFTIDVLERNNGQAGKLLFSFVGMDDVQAQNIVLNRRIAEQATFTDFFLSTYESAYYIGFDDRSCQIYKRTEQLERDYPVITDYFDSLKKYIGEAVHPEDREQLLQLVVPEKMQAILKDRAEYTHIFRDISYGKEKIYLMQVIRGADDAHAAFGFKDVTEEMKKQNEAQRHIAIEQNNRRIMALEDNLESLYDVDLETGRYIEYVKGDFYRQNVTDKLVREGDFFSDILENIKTVIFPEDQEGLKNLLDRENLRQALSKTERVEHFYRLNVGEKPLWLKMRIVYKDSEKKSLVFGCFNAQEEMAQKRRNDDLVKTFSKQFSAVYYGDLESGSYQILVRKENVLSIIKGTDTICDAIKVFAEKTVHPDDRRLFMGDFYSLDSIQAKIPVGESYSFEYRSDNYGDYRWFKAEFRRTNEQDLLVGFRDCNDEVLERLEHERLQKEMEVQHALSDGLAREYHTVWLVDGFGDHLLHLYRSTGKTTVKKAVQLGLRVPSYDSAMAQYVMDSVHEDDRDRVLEATKFETIARETPDVGTYVVSYKRYNDEGSVDYHQMCFAKAVADDGIVNYILAYRDADKMLREQISQQNRLTEALKVAEEEAKRNELLHDVIHSGQWTFSINANDEITRADYSAKLASIIDYDLPKELNAWTTIVHPDDLPDALAAFNAAIADHSGKTPYDVVYRMRNRNGEYRWFHSAGQILREADGSGEFFGVHLDVTEAVKEQQRRLLGAVPVSPDILAKENIGMWAFELDEGCAPRMYDDETMLGLVGLDHQVPPEEAYHAWYDHIDKDSYDLVADAVAKMSSGQHAEVQYPWHHPDGRTRMVRCGGVRNFEYTKGIRIEGTHQDVTETLHYDEEQNRIMRELASQQRHLKSFGDMVNAASWKLLIKGENEVASVDWSDELRAMFGFGDENDFPNVLESWSDRIHPEDKERVLDHFHNSILTKEEELVCDVEFRYQRKSGEYVWYHAYGRMENINDVSRTFYGIIVDISSEKQIEEQQEQLQEALSMAQSANRAKTTFLNNMSHDIRTPMNAIIGYTGLAASHIDNKAQVQDYLSKIGQSSDHLLSLINDVLDMSRIESGKMNLDEKEENLSDIIHTLRDIVQADIHSKQIDFYVDAVEVHDENIVCDKLRLNQVLLNILSNAIKYTPVGGTVTMRVVEKTVKESGYGTYEFIVKDSGMGMDKEFLDTIFDPFTRVKSSTVSGIQGTGLGMAITKNIIDMMGGRIDIASTPGKGTEVVVSLDFKLKGAPKEVLPIPDLKGLRALVVDDDANTCLSISRMIREIGMKEEWCTSGKEAVIRATEAYHIGSLFKVYIIDWMMPDMNGIETTRRIRKVIGDDAPIIVLTAYDWADIEDEAREAGVTEFVSKPMFPSDLHRVLSKCLGDKSDQKQKKEEFDLGGKKILLVEDNELNREIATAILEEYGCIVHQAEDGEVAVEKMKTAKSGDYDLVLMDVQMPTIDGYEATRQIRALGTEISKIPVLAMTANAFEEDRKAALDAGMDEHLAKPIDMETLKKTLAKFL